MSRVFDVCLTDLKIPIVSSLTNCSLVFSEIEEFKKLNKTTRERIHNFLFEDHELWGDVVRSSKHASEYDFSKPPFNEISTKNYNIYHKQVKDLIRRCQRKSERKKIIVLDINIATDLERQSIGLIGQEFCCREVIQSLSVYLESVVKIKIADRCESVGRYFLDSVADLKAGILALQIDIPLDLILYTETKSDKSQDSVKKILTILASMAALQVERLN